MDPRYRHLPQLAALAGFEAAARLGSFSLAAEELHMTQSAISHQIKALEAQLGQPLFVRANRAVTLTDAGRDFQRTAIAALETLRQGVRRLGFYTKPGSVVLQVPPGLARCWLAPRLPRLLADRPEVEPWIYSSTEPHDLAEAEIDIAIRRGHGPREGVREAPLLRERLRPLASPKLLATLPNPVSAADLLTLRLIHDEGERGWHEWFRQAGVIAPDIVKGLNMSDPSLALDAAARGLGVVLADTALANEWTERRALVAIPDMPVLEAAQEFHLLAHPRALQNPIVAGLWDWLVRAGQETERG